MSAIKPARRKFIKDSAAIAGGLTFAGSLASCAGAQSSPLFDISLAQWSLYKMLFSGELDALDFPVFTRTEFDISAVEYVNQFFMDKAEDSSYLAQLKQRCEDSGVKSLLIMCDGEGALGDPDTAARIQSVENHYKWVTAAATLGCHSIRVNAQSSGSYDSQLGAAADGLGRLCEFAAGHDMNVIVENHGGLSSNGKWLASVIEQVNQENCGTLPDFGNFTISEDERYDNYQGVSELMPYAKGVSAKSYDFDEQGNSIRIDFERMLKIVVDAGYSGYIGVEWEGQEPGPVEGVKLTKALLERVRAQLSV